jgi:hypothetical protein
VGATSGVNLINTGTWTLGSGVTNSSGTLTASVGTSAHIFYQSGFTSGSRYRVKFDFTFTSAANLMVNLSSSPNTDNGGTQALGQQSSGTLLFDVVADANGVIGIGTDIFGGFTGTLSNISIEAFSSFTSSAGSGGGGGGGGGSNNNSAIGGNGGNAGGYGGGGGGTGGAASATGKTAGAGTQGAIIITYTARIAASLTVQNAVSPSFAVAPSSPVAWDSATTAPDFTISGGGLTATRNTFFVDTPYARALPFRTSGVLVFKPTISGAPLYAVGLSDGTASTAQLGKDTHSCAYWSDGSIVANGGVINATGITYGTGDTIICDYSDGVHVVFKKNGVVVWTLDVSTFLPASLQPVFSTNSFDGSAAATLVPIGWGDQTTISPKTSLLVNSALSTTLARVANGLPLVIWDSNTANTSTNYSLNADGVTLTSISAAATAEAIGTVGKLSASGEGYFEVTPLTPGNTTVVGLTQAGDPNNYVHGGGFGFLNIRRINLRGTDLVNTASPWNPVLPTAWSATGQTNPNWSVTGLTATSASTGGLLVANGFNHDGYVEFTIPAAGSGEFEIGFTYSDNANTNRPSADGVGYRSTGSLVFLGSAQAGTYPTLAAGDVVGMYLDTDSAHLYISKNGTWLNGADPVAGTGGIAVQNFWPAFPFYPAAWTNGAGCQITLNLAGPFTYTVPNNWPFYHLDTVGIYLRAGKAWVHKNGKWQGTGGDPSQAGPGYDLTGIASTIYPAISTPDAGASYRANFGASPFVWPIPSNGTSWDGTQRGPLGPALIEAEQGNGVFSAFSAGPSGWGSVLSQAAGTSTDVTGSDVIAVGSNTYTVDVRVKLPAAPGGTKFITSLLGKFWIGVFSDGLLAFHTGSEQVSANFNLADNAWHSLRLVMKGAAGAEFYVDGTMTASTSTPGATASAGTNGFIIGDLNGNPSSAFTSAGGLIDEVAIWSVAKTGAYTPPTSPYVGDEANLRGLWHLNGDFKPAPYGVPAFNLTLTPHAGSGGATLSLNNAVSAAQAGNVALSPKTTVTVQAASSTSQAGGVTLAPKTLLALAAALSLSQLDNVSAAGHNSVVLANAVSASQTTSPVLLPKTTITVQPAGSSGQADNVTLGVTGSLSAASAISLSQATSPTLLPKTSLITNGSVSLSQLDALAVAAKYALALSNANSAGQLDALALVPKTSLLPANSSSLTFTTSPTLVSKYALAILDAVSPSIADGVGLSVTGSLGMSSAVSLTQAGAPVLLPKWAIAPASAISLTQTDNILLALKYALSLANLNSLSQLDPVALANAKYTLVPASAISLTQAGNVTLANVHYQLLTDSAVSLTQTTSPTLATAGTLGLSSAISLTQTSSPVLLPKTALGPNDAASFGQVTSPTLLPKTSLLLNGAVSTGQADAVTLGTGGTLGVSSAVSFAKADNLVLAPKTAIFIDNAASGSFTSSPNLSARYALVAADLNSTGQLDALTLVPKTGLVVADAFSTEVISSFVLASNYTLAVLNVVSLSQTTGVALFPKTSLITNSAVSLSFTTSPTPTYADIFFGPIVIRVRDRRGVEAVIGPFDITG